MNTIQIQEKRELLQLRIQPRLAALGGEIEKLRCSSATVTDSATIVRINLLQAEIDSVNDDFYLLIDQKESGKALR